MNTPQTEDESAAAAGAAPGSTCSTLQHAQYESHGVLSAAKVWCASTEAETVKRRAGNPAESEVGGEGRAGSGTAPAERSSRGNTKGHVSRKASDYLCCERQREDSQTTQTADYSKRTRNKCRPVERARESRPVTTPAAAHGHSALLAETEEHPLPLSLGSSSWQPQRTSPPVNQHNAPRAPPSQPAFAGGRFVTVIVR